MSEVFVQFVNLKGETRKTVSLHEKGAGTNELVIMEGGRIINLKHLDPELSLIVTGRDGNIIGEERIIEPGETGKFDLPGFFLRIIHEPAESISLK